MARTAFLATARANAMLRNVSSGLAANARPAPLVAADRRARSPAAVVAVVPAAALEASPEGAAVVVAASLEGPAESPVVVA